MPKDPSAARHAKQLNKQKREKNNNQRIMGRQKAQIKKLKQSHIDQFYKPTSHNTFAGGIIQEMGSLSIIKPKARRYSDNFKKFCKIILFTSFTCYVTLKSLGFPMISPFYMRKICSTTRIATKTAITNLSFIGELLDEYKEKNNLSSDFRAVLAIDAVSFYPQICIDEYGKITGAKIPKINQKKYNKISKDFSEFEKYVNSVKNVTFTDAFVIQLHPLEKNYSCQVLHIIPSVQGKATNNEVDKLLDIKKKCDDSGINIIALAFDGDNTYNKLHSQFILKYKYEVSSNYSFINFSSISTLGIVSDPLHLLKRARYRILSNNLSQDFYNPSKIIDIQKTKQLFDLPSIVYSNSKITKMHDSLPLMLFDLKNLLLLFSKCEKELASYFLPFALLRTSLKEVGLTNSERLNLLQIAFFYSFLYLHSSEEVGLESLPQFKSANKKIVRMYDNKIITELCNTLFVLITQLFSKEGMLYLNRIGTNPLEHTFGMVRMRSKNKHTYDKLVNKLGEEQMLKDLRKELNVSSKINSRLEEFGPQIINDLNHLGNTFQYNCRDIAIALYIWFGFQYKNRYLESPFWIEIRHFYQDIADNFVTQMNAIYFRLHPTPQRVKLSSVHLSIGTSANIINRLKSSTILDTKEWTEEEDKLISNYQGDFEKIHQLLPYRNKEEILKRCFELNDER